MNNSASKQYVINQLPDDPSQISSFVINFATNQILGLSAAELRGYRVGKLVFGMMWWPTPTGGNAPVLFWDDATTEAQIAGPIATALGFSGVANWYGGENYGAETLVYSGVSWSNTTPGNTIRNVIWGFIGT